MQPQWIGAHDVTVCKCSVALTDPVSYGDLAFRCSPSALLQVKLLSSSSQLYKPCQTQSPSLSPITHGKIFIFAVLERWLIHFNETECSFVYVIINNNTNITVYCFVVVLCAEQRYSGDSYRASTNSQYCTSLSSSCSLIALITSWW